MLKKFIHVSAIGANENSKSLYQRSKFQGEINALNFEKYSDYKTKCSVWNRRQFYKFIFKIKFFTNNPNCWNEL